MLRQSGGSRGVRAIASPSRSKAGEAEYYRLPQTPQSGDPYAAGAVRVQFKVGGRGLAQKTKGGFGLAEPCRDQRVDPRAQRTAMGTAWLVVAEIGFRRRAGNSSGRRASSATTSACLTTCDRCVRSRPITTSIGICGRRTARDRAAPACDSRQIARRGRWPDRDR